MPDAYPDPAALIAQTTPPRSPNPPDNPEPEPTADQEPDNDEHVDFPIPENFQPPEDAKPGKSFQALATLKLGDDGKTLSLIAVDGAAVKPGEEAEEPDEDEQPGGEEPATMADALKQGLPATGMPA